MKKILLIWGLVLCIFSSYAGNPISLNTAKKLAQTFYYQQMGLIDFPGIEKVEEVKFLGVNSFYAINLNKNGFILVAADDASMPVLGYSSNGKYDSENHVEAFDKTIANFQLQIKYLQDNNIQATPYIKSQWKKYLSSKAMKSTTSSIGPLLSTIWAQGCYYNDSTPVDAGGPCGHVVTGCVATAMAQVLKYHNYPSVGSGSYSYASSYGKLSANFGATTYNWTSMPDSLSSLSSGVEVSTIAQLISQCGIAVDMMYSAGSSGAYSQDAANAFAHYFNYDSGLKLLHKSSFPDSTWEHMIISELDSLRPLYYDGSGSGGHAFVCDGYQGKHYFHFNWGWSGSHNGYFLLTALNPGGMNFSNGCGAVFGMKPGVPQACNSLTDTLIAKAANINDGSYDLNYQDNTNCSWLINPNDANSISLAFYTFDLLVGDSVIIYDGNNSSSPRIGAFSGNTIPSSIASSGNEMFIQFISNSTANAGGWSAFYRSEYCNGLKVYNDQFGSIADESGLETYNDNTNCYWLINDSLNRAINLEFTDFKTEQSYDYVDVYDGSSTTTQLLGSFSGHSLPQKLTALSGQMLIHFHTDGGVIDDGWEANYYVCGQSPAAAKTDSLFHCKGDSSTLIIPNHVDSFLWVFNGAPQNSIITQQWSVAQAGNYSYIAYSNYCPNTSSEIVTVVENPLPNVDLGNDTLLCTSQVLLLHADSGFAYYDWSTGDTSNSILFFSTMGNFVSISLQIEDNNGCQNQDSIDVEFQTCASINKIDIKELDIKVFPNPTTNELKVELSESVNYAEVNILDMQGKYTIKKQLVNGNKMNINLSHLRASTYCLEVKIQGQRYQKLFIKQ